MWFFFNQGEPLDAYCFIACSGILISKYELVESKFLHIVSRAQFFMVEF